MFNVQIYSEPKQGKERPESSYLCLNKMCAAALGRNDRHGNRVKILISSL